MENAKTQFDERIQIQVTDDFKSAVIAMPNGTELPVGNVVAETNPLTGGSRFLLSGDVVSGEWVSTPPILKMLLNGTGTISMDSRDASGAVTTGAVSMTLSGASNLMTYDFFPGETAMAVRFNLTGSATAKVI